MGKAYSTQLKIRNSTSSRITTCVSRIKPKQWIGPNRPDNNFHNVGISPGSDYSREESINLRSPVNAFTLLLTFDNGKRLEFRIDQGRVAGKKRCRCRSKDKNKFVFVGDDTAFDVTDTISGNTLTIEIKDSYMYKFSIEDAKKKAEMIAHEQAKAAALARVKAEEERKAMEADKARKEVKAALEEAVKVKEEEAKRVIEEAEREAERVAHRVADAKREREEMERRVEEIKVKADVTDGPSLETLSPEEKVKQIEEGVEMSKPVDGNVQVETYYVAIDDPQLRISGDDHLPNDSENTVSVTSVKLPREASDRIRYSGSRKSSEVTVHVTVDQHGDIRVQIEEIMDDGNTSTSGDESVFSHDGKKAIEDSVNELDNGQKFDAIEEEVHTDSSRVVKRSIETHF